jgi:hypothetical protein
MAVILPVARQQYTDGNGFPLVGGSVAFCQPNTSGTQFRPIYADEAETIPLSNPCPLDSAGITFSGGSQVSVWGFGAYEEFVRDSDGNLIYSAVIDTPSGQTGGTIQGSVQINGDLSVTGNITDTQSLTSPQINGTNGSFGGTLNVNTADISILNVTNATINGLTVGNETIEGNEQVNGSVNVNGLITSGGVQTGPIVATTVNAAEFLISGQPFLTTRGGSGQTDDTGTLNVTFNPPFNNALAMVACLNGPGADAEISTGNLSNGGGTVFALSDVDGAGFAGNVFWIAVGT